MAPQPNGPRATAALVVSVVLLVSGLILFLALLFRPAALGVMDDRVLYAAVGYFSATMAGITLMLRYWFPPKSRRDQDDDEWGK